MKIIIIGGGMVGTQLARHLINEKHTVTLIEHNEERARHASNRLDCMVICEEANNFETLESAGITKADALVCVTDSDELNMIICGLAEAKVPNLLKIARVRNQDYNNQMQSGIRTLGVDHFVHPDIEGANSVLNAVEHGAMGDVLAFGDSDFELGSIDLSKKSIFVNRQVREFTDIAGCESLVALIERGEESILPSGLTTIMPGDRIHVLAKENDLAKIFELTGKKMKTLKKIGIVGGSLIGEKIAEGLLGVSEKQGKQKFSLFSFLSIFKPKRQRKVTIIENDYSLCKELSAKFPNAIVLNEDISDESFVTEEGIDDLDLIITSTSNQELNMITALYLKSRGVEKTIALVSSPGYVAIARRLGIDVVIPMNTVVVDSILTYLLGGGVKRVHRLGEEGLLELSVTENCSLVGKRLSEIKLPSSGLVLLVKREENSFIPRGDYSFTTNDIVVILVKKGGEAEMNRLFNTQL